MQYEKTSVNVAAPKSGVAYGFLVNISSLTMRHIECRRLEVKAKEKRAMMICVKANRIAVRGSELK